MQNNERRIHPHNFFLIGRKVVKTLISKLIGKLRILDVYFPHEDHVGTLSHPAGFFNEEHHLCKHSNLLLNHSLIE